MNKTTRKLLSLLLCLVMLLSFFPAALAEEPEDSETRPVQSEEPKGDIENEEGSEDEGTISPATDVPEETEIADEPGDALVSEEAVFRPSYSSSYLSKCTYYPSYLTAKATSDCKVWSQPCNNSTDSNSEHLTTISKGSTFTVTGMYKNTANHYWYKVKISDGTEGFVYTAYTSVSSYKSNFRYTGKSFPTTLTVGDKYPVDWTVYTDNLYFTTLCGYIYSESDTVNPVYSKTLTNISSSIYRLNNSAIDNALLFNYLPAGNYLCCITATSNNYYSTDGETIHSRLMIGEPILFHFSEVAPATPTYYLDLNGCLDGEDVGHINGYGTADVYINGTLVDPGTTDYYTAWPSGTTYEIKNIQPAANVSYDGAKSGPVSGTLTSNTNVRLSFQTVPDGTPTAVSEKSFNGSTYTFFTTPVTWYEANVYCERMGGHLVTIGSQEENAFVLGLVGNSDCWLGLRRDSSGSFSKWINGESLAYTNWHSGEPSNNVMNDERSESFVCFTDFSSSFEGEWNDVYGYYKSPFVCEKARTYTVSYNANGGTGAPASQTKTHDVPLTLSSQQPTRSSTSAGSYTVTLNPNGGSVNTTSLTAARTTSYTFRNWNTAANGSGTAYGSGASYTANASATLYAQWNSNTSTAAVTLPTPTRSGYAFKGWATGSSASGGVTGSYTPTGSVTLYAIWSQNKPAITTQPKSVSATEGSTATFTVVASGSNLSYQWQWRAGSSGTWANSSSATVGYNTATLQVTASAARNGYQYRCAVSNSAGTVYSNAATLTVTVNKPAITTQPKNVSVTEGSTATFTVVASGTGLSYQWQWRAGSTGTWANSSSATVGYNTATLQVAASEARNGYQYRCAVSNSAGTTYSNAATLTVNLDKPVITAQPKSVTKNVGETAKFAVTASGSNLSYQWQWRAGSSGTWANSSQTGYNTAALSIPVTAARDGQQYRCAVTNSAGTVYSSAATLTVSREPEITGQPKSVKAAEGTTAKFTVTATGTSLNYQWQWRSSSSGTWANSSSATTGYNQPTLQVAVTAGRNGYQYRCKISNSAGAVYSSVVTLTVDNSLTITAQPKSVAAEVGTTAKFTVSASGGNLSYQWQWRAGSSGTWANSSQTGNKTATLSIPVTAARSGQQYRCKISNSKETVYSSAATLTAIVEPEIITQPKNLTASVDTTASFTVKASGGNLSYQWQWRAGSSGTWANSSQTGSKTATLSIPATLARSGQQYRCRISNSAGTVFTNTVTLTVTAKPVITTQPKSVSVTEGSTAKFTVVASGTNLSYQWQWRAGSSGTWANSTRDGAKTATLSVPATAARSGQQYRCIVTNANGSVYSSAATLTVK